MKGRSVSSRPYHQVEKSFIFPYGNPVDHLIENVRPVVGRGHILSEPDELADAASRAVSAIIAAGLIPAGLIPAALEMIA